MLAVQISVAEGRFSELVQQVEHGETVVLTREGRAVARIVPEPLVAGSRSAFEALAAYRAKAPRIAVEEILSARDEGRRP